MSASIIRKGCQPWAAIPYAVIEHKALSPTARLVAAWIIGKPSGWEIRITFMLESLGLTRKQWNTVKKQFSAAGIFQQARTRGAGGKIEWSCEFNADAIINASVTQSNDERNGERNTTVPFGIDGEGCNKNKEVNKEEKSLKAKVASADAADDDLKRMHIGHTLNALGIAWEQRGRYIYWDDYTRARKDPKSGHWLWAEVGGDGTVSNSGTAVDLIALHEQCSLAKAFQKLRAIYGKAAQQ